MQHQVCIISFTQSVILFIRSLLVKISQLNYFLCVFSYCPLRIAILVGIQWGATTTEIKEAFKKKARELHPDVNRTDSPEEALKKFQLVQKAYSKLMDVKGAAHRDDLLEVSGLMWVWSFCSLHCLHCCKCVVESIHIIFSGTALVYFYMSIRVKY